MRPADKKCDEKWLMPQRSRIAYIDYMLPRVKLIDKKNFMCKSWRNHEGGIYLNNWGTSKQKIYGYPPRKTGWDWGWRPAPRLVILKPLLKNPAICAILQLRPRGLRKKLWRLCLQPCLYHVQCAEWNRTVKKTGTVGVRDLCWREKGNTSASSTIKRGYLFDLMN